MADPTSIPTAEIVTGERLQSLADVTIATDAVVRFHTSLPASCNVVRFPGDFGTFVIDDWTKLEQIRSARSIFVYTHLLLPFVNLILPHLDQPFVLISHNSANVINEAWRPLADHPKIKRWFAQNGYLAHPKMICLPLGIANAQWPHGDIAILADVMAQQRPKRRFLYANFQIATNSAARKPMHDFLSELGYATMATAKPYRPYLEEMAEHRYCVSPPGYGIDCHRTWEALYLGVVPIVAAFAAEPFNDMRLLPFKDVDDFHPGYLEQAYRLFESHSFTQDKLRLSWWRQQIDRAVAA